MYVCIYIYNSISYNKFLNDWELEPCLPSPLQGLTPEDSRTFDIVLTGRFEHGTPTIA